MPEPPFPPPAPPLRPGLRPRLAGLWALVRWLPVLSWLGGSVAIGTGAALGWSRLSASGTAAGHPRLPALLDLLLIVLAGVLLQGLLAHSLNDREDWRTGTDAASPGLLSGGTRVIPRGQLSSTHLTRTALAAALAALAIAIRFSLRVGPGALLLWLIAAWAGAAYSLPPLRLAYRPLAGEWLCAYPAAAAGAVGTCFLLTGTLPPAVFLAGAIHGLFCLAWLMLHHLADIPGDLAAHPPKLTTPAWLFRRSPGLARLPAPFYLTLAAVSSAAATRLPGAGPAFHLPVALALAGLPAAASPRLGDVADLTRRELLLILLSLAEAASLAAGLNRYR
ncbi:MAG: prenyltransferase [Methanocella sp.]